MARQTTTPAGCGRLRDLGGGNGSLTSDFFIFFLSSKEINDGEGNEGRRWETGRTTTPAGCGRLRDLGGGNVHCSAHLWSTQLFSSSLPQSTAVCTEPTRAAASLPQPPLPSSQGELEDLDESFFMKTA
ncbi:hypothetical protein LguiA_016657 [Lonicera macranthoides]